MPISPQDQDLIRLLTANARESTTTLARKLGVARSTVQSRIARLESEGIISGYTVRIAPETSRRRSEAHVMIAVDPKRVRQVEVALERIDALQALFSVSGAFDLIAFVAAESPSDLDAVLDRIRDIDGVQTTNSSIVLCTKFDRRGA